MTVNPILEPRALAHETGPPPEELPALPRVKSREPDRGKEMHPEQLGQFACVDRIRLGARLPDELHVKGMGAAHGVSGLDAPCGEPVPIERGLEPDRYGAWQCAEPRAHGRDRRGQLTDLGDDPPVSSRAQAVM